MGRNVGLRVERVRPAEAPARVRAERDVLVRRRGVVDEPRPVRPRRVLRVAAWLGFAALSLAFAGQGALILHCADNWQSTKWWRLNALVGILVLVIVSANTALLVEYWDVMAPTVAVAVLQVILNAWLVFVSVVQLLAALKVSCAASLEGEPLLQAPAAGASVS